ncbi:MAG: beta-galactosidase [Calditrichaceae bacterium]|nr:beta-galactosidase [Calditrichaceae bacterium]MBN2708130.1 beta-galactosidase [Calditrichaceae bacterium]
MKSRTPKISILILFFYFFTYTLQSQELYVGANYHPHDDKNYEKISKDIRLMKEAGFNVVRMGHLAWDSYEPSEGNFDFEWFDEVMDLMNQAGIKVILDIAIRPVPIWLHYKYPSISITDEKGNVLYPNHRYMEDIGDPMYQKYALRFTDVMSRRYADHPALLAFGIDNESGDGKISYSKSARQRFIIWLKKKYKTIKSLNKAWAGQRWSRKINQWDEIGFPILTHYNDVPERLLDFRRFVSDEINELLIKVINIVNTNAPGALVNTNAWYFSYLKYFDYAPIAYSGKMTRGGEGFYAGTSLVNNAGIVWAAFGIVRIQYESTNPFWCNEFTTMTAVPNTCRKQAYASLMYGNQMVCGWTWQSMHNGEEQYLQGLIDWDGVPNRKYYEYKEIATEFKKIEKFLPYKPQAEVGLAFSFPSQIVSYSYPESHDGQVGTCFNQFFERNMDVRMLDISRSDLNYKLLIIPGMTVMDPITAGKIREFVYKGGTALMTGYSAFVDTTNKVFASARPGLLNDVFGIRIGGFEEIETMNEISRISYQGENVRVNYKGKNLETKSPRYDIIKPDGAKVIGSITSLDKDYPVITVNQFGSGKAIYIGLPARAEVLNPLLDDLINELSIKKGPVVPDSVMARQIDENHIMYLNISNQPKKIELKGKLRSLLFNKDYTNNFTIAPYEPEFIEVR